MIVAIDGPAGAGKSSVARRLATHLGFVFLDTGAMYRAVTLACLRAGLPLDQEDQTSRLASTLSIRLDGERVWLNDEDVTAAIRTTEVTQSIRWIADNATIRGQMVDLQRKFAYGQNVVTEGRDQGTVAFPDAECKIYLTASPEERARRRVRQLEALGAIANFEEILDQQNRRDREDQSRKVGALRMAQDAIEVMTDGKTEEEVLDQLSWIVAQARSRHSS